MAYVLLIMIFTKVCAKESFKKEKKDSQKTKSHEKRLKKITKD